MGEKRFVEFMTQNSDDGELNCGFTDINNHEWYYTKNRVNAKKCVDLLNKQEGRIKELEKENEELKQRIKEETDRVIKLEQYVHTKLCPKSENYNEKVVSAIINTILGDVE